jgi:hypothetical protein
MNRFLVVSLLLVLVIGIVTSSGDNYDPRVTEEATSLYKCFNMCNNHLTGKSKEHCRDDCHQRFPV